MVAIAVMGYGTIGSGVVEVIERNKKSITERAGEEICVRYVLDLRDFPGDPVQEKVVHDVNVILEDPEVSIVVETMGGTKPAYDYVKSALLAGKSVCTSNKELVAKHGAELLNLARGKNLNFLFEASVGGGIPIIRPLNQSLTSDEIYEITGILNGTTNYILTKMAREGAGFETVLKQAQDLGYAERNPSADVDGFDACRKIAILSSLAYGHQVDYEDIYTEGITKITAEDFKYAALMKRSIKLFGMSKREDGKFYAMVSPVMIDEDHALYSVNDVFNGILVKGEVIDQLMFYGRGAGKLPTASAVVADVIDAAKHRNRNIMTTWHSSKLTLAPIDDSEKRFFVRVRGELTEGRTRVERLFGPVEYVDAGLPGEFGFVTGTLSEKEFSDKSKELEDMITRIRLEE
ncbi:MAG: homoserine dehydrogenase [Lachnospiraceae bacterium]|nr:homoserine dehydrogenase [Lachnospiraceae bacterium]